MKKCTKCLGIKPLVEFTKNKQRKSGYDARCKICNNAINKIWNSNNRDKIRIFQNKRQQEKRKKYIEAHPKPTPPTLASIYNPETMALVPFSTNSYTDDTHFIVDKEDYENVMQFKWHASTPRRTGNYVGVIYPTRHAYEEEITHGTPTKFGVHRYIMNTQFRHSGKNETTDHINGQTLDNRKVNLRVCELSVNMRNRRDNVRIGLGLWGATFLTHVPETARNKWFGNFSRKGKTYNAGYYATEEEAHLAAKKMLLELFGE
jgi:hypothetical protein